MLSRSCWALLFLCAAAGFFGWLGLGTPPEELGTPPELGIPPHIPFEMITGDERFQAEATSCELSPLDSCHCQVMVRLRSPCADLSEEEEEDAAKLGVDLVNCPASAEGLRTYPCMPDTVKCQDRAPQILFSPIPPQIQCHLPPPQIPNFAAAEPELHPAASTQPLILILG
ncbi:protein brambleberry-like [Harpia harpyja]|uniref:protein brambleberry-like n=1 Tax=Harpia harpyja TaxID=202280 RepID=UPI0022B1F027|nr:protein brambleberry-like [Harpia harpyja]